MFFRHKFNSTGKTVQLIESFRDTEGRPRQRILLSLGDASIPKHLWRDIARVIENHLQGVESLLPVEPEAQHWIEKLLRELERKKPKTLKAPSLNNPITTKEEIPVPVAAIGLQLDFSSVASDCFPVPPNGDQPIAAKNLVPQLIHVDPTKISHRNTTELGPELAILKAWEALGIDALLNSLGFSRRHAELALLSIANRLIDPCSEHALPDWVKTTSFPDLLHHIPIDLIDDHFYRITDKLLNRKNQIETTLAEKEQSLFSLQRTLYLYDTSNTYFEGLCEKNPKAQRSENSKERRTDAKQIAFGLVLDEQGFVIKHETFPGNMHDSKTLLQMIEALEKGSKRIEKPMIVIDSGFSGEANLQKLREMGYDYIATGRRPTRIAYEDDFNNKQFRKISGREGKEPVSIAFRDEEKERVVLCHSEARGEKEKGMLSSAEKRFLKDIEKLSKRLAKGGLKKQSAANQALGRIRERHSRVTRYYELLISVQDDGKHTLSCKRLDEEYLKAERICGSYYMRCSRKTLADEEIWKLYMMLTRVEAGFKTLKSDLGLRPIFHHREDRCDSHIFITVLAYRILHWIEYMLRQKEDNRSWATIRRVLQTHSYTTITCPDEGGDVYHIRAPGTPDIQQKEIYNALNVCWKSLPRNYVIREMKSSRTL